MLKDLLPLAATLLTGLGMLQLITSYPVLTFGIVLLIFWYGTLKVKGN
jgi:hypothetical protein